MRDLAIFDALLSSKRRGGDLDLNFIESNYNFPMNKTKSISKNYNTRIFRTIGKIKVSFPKICPDNYNMK
jgi:hypothetical protein